MGRCRTHTGFCWHRICRRKDFSAKNFVLVIFLLGILLTATPLMYDAGFLGPGTKSPVFILKKDYSISSQKASQNHDQFRNQNQLSELEKVKSVPMDVLFNERRERIQTVCKNHNLISSNTGNTQQFKKVLSHLVVNEKYHTTFCLVGKVGSTFWGRFFTVMSGVKKFENFTSPYDIPPSQSFLIGNGFRTPTVDKGKMIMEKSTNIMFSRNPYSRLFSTYIDKLFAPNPYYWKGFGVKAIKHARRDASRFSLECGHDLTFAEYVKYIIYINEKSQSKDAHVISVNEVCSPCYFRYDLIGKMESFHADVFHVMKTMGFHDTLKSLNSSFEKDHEKDAILDTINSPFEWMKDITKCMTMDEALRRLWRKLQIRGLLGIKSKFPFSVTDVEQMTVTRFIDTVIRTKSQTPEVDRKKSRKDASIEIYKSVPLEDLRRLHSLYALDFELFDYEKEPVHIFDRKQQTILYGFLNFTSA